METNLALVSPKPALGVISSLNPSSLSTKQCFGLPLLYRKSTWSASTSRPISRTALFAFSRPNSRRRPAQNNDDGKRDNKVELFASASTRDSSQETTSVGVNPQPYASPPPSQIGSPLFWIAVGVGFSAVFSFVASRVKQYATQQAFKTMMGQMGPQSSQSPFSYPPPYTSGSSPSSGFPYPASSAAGPSTPSGFSFQPPSTSGPSTSTVSADSSVPFQAATSPAASETAAAVDTSAIKAEAAATEAVEDEIEVKNEAKRSGTVSLPLGHLIYCFLNVVVDMLMYPLNFQKWNLERLKRRNYPLYSFWMVCLINLRTRPVVCRHSHMSGHT